MMQETPTPQDVPSHDLWHDPSTAAAETLRRMGLVVLLIVAPLAAFWFRRAGVILAPMGGLLLLLSFIFDPRAGGIPWLKIAQRYATAWAAIAIMLVYMALSLTWSPYGADGADRLLRLVSTLALVAMILLLLPNKWGRKDALILPLGVVLGLLVMVFFTASPPPKGSVAATIVLRGSLAQSLLIWPALALLLLWGYEKTTFVLALLAAVVTLLQLRLLGVLMVGGSTAIFFAVYRFEKKAIQSLALLFAGLLLAWPLLSLGQNANYLSLIPQTQSALKVIAGVLFGHGLESIRAHEALEPAPLTNLPMVLWYEFGLLGVLAISFAAYTALRQWPLIKPLVAGALAAGVAQIIMIWFATDVGLQSWWLMAQGLGVLMLTVVWRSAVDDARRHTNLHSNDAF